MRSHSKRWSLFLAMVIFGLCLIPAITQAATYPAVFFYADEDYEDLIIEDTVTVGEGYEIRMKWYPEYKNEGYELEVVNSSGKAVAQANDTFTNTSNEIYKKINIKWDTGGIIGTGNYTVKVKIKFYSNYSWNYAPRIAELPIRLIDPNYYECGPDAEFNISDGVLTIRGTGKIYDWDYTDQPWYKYREEITKIVIEDGITVIGENCFNYLTNVTEVQLPASLRSFKKWAFYNCKSLSELTIPANASLEERPFKDSGIKDLYLPSTLSGISQYSFYDMPKLTNIYFNGTQAQWDQIVGMIPARRQDDFYDNLKDVNIILTGNQEDLSPTDKIRAFVTRNYRVILDREPDADGLNYWVQRLASGEATAAQIIKGFVDSIEFRNKNLSYGDQVEVLYQVMLDRGSDEAGKAYWVSMLNGGNTLAAVINGFCNSIEFKGICDEYGITPGSVDAGEAKQPQQEAPAPSVDRDKIRAYVTRCYRIILSREPDQEGLNYWTEKMASGELQAAAIIDQFVNSIEFKGKQLSNQEAVEVLYQAMLGRGSDEAGMGYWLEKLNAGEPFAVIINGFCNSVEFKGICAEYGITPGSVAVASVRTHAEPEEQEIPEAEATEPEQEAEPAPADERTEQARAFVTHCYQSALLRDPSAEETDYYANQILSGQMTAKDVARAFAFSQEFQGKWTDSTAFVRVLYRLCLDREADADGLVYWTDKLANDETAAAVFNALTENKEFVQVCATYGMPAGVDVNAIRAQEEAAAAEAEESAAPAAPASEFTNEEKIRAFVSRFYRDAMGREADEEGLNYYTGRILNGEATPKDVAGEIILSEEFRSRMPGNEDLVRILYRVYLGREADEEGLANWAGQLDSGVALETILNGFASSEEFAAVVNGLK